LKIRLDENLSYRVGSAIIAFMENREGYEVSHNSIVAPGSKDPAWLAKFADEGGNIIISGDYRILQHWPDLVAYTESGLVSFFPPSAFGQLKGFGRAAFILRWWPCIIEKFKSSNRGDRWRLPMQWTPDPEKIRPIEDPRLATDDQKEALGIEPLAQQHHFRGQSAE
jgi:hypothetical protein